MTKKIVDIATVILLAAAFILAFYTGFVSKTATGEPVLATKTLAIISVLGVGVLFGVGGASTAYDRIKRGMVTRSFLIFFIVQMLAVVGMAAIMFFVATEMYTVDNRVIRMFYMIFAMINVIGYVDAMLYSDSMAAYDAANGVDEPEAESDESDVFDEFEKFLDEFDELEEDSMESDEEFDLSDDESDED